MTMSNIAAIAVQYITHRSNSRFIHRLPSWWRCTEFSMNYKEWPDLENRVVKSRWFRRSGDQTIAVQAACGWWIRYRVVVYRLYAVTFISIDSPSAGEWRRDANDFGRAVKWPNWNGRSKLCQSKVSLLHFVCQHGYNDARCHWSQDQSAVRIVSVAGLASWNGRATVERSSRNFPDPSRRRSSSMPKIAVRFTLADISSTFQRVLCSTRPSLKIAK